MMKLLVAPIALCLLFSVSFAQRTRRGTPTKQQAPATAPTPGSTPATVSIPKPAGNPVPIVVVNDLIITSAQFNPSVRQQWESVDYEIAKARKEIFEQQVNTLVLGAEARKRGISTARLYEIEVTNKLIQPTAAEVKKWTDEHSSQFSGSGLSEADVAKFLLEEREGKLADQLVERLRKLYPVSSGVDINTPNLKDDVVIATAAGQPVTAANLNERMKPVVYKLRLNAYEAAKKNADQLVNDQLLLAEANRKQIGPEEIIRKEITEKIHPPTDAEITKFYEENKSRINGDLQSVRNPIGSYLQEQQRQTLENEMSVRLRKGVEIRWLINEPPQPVQAISVDNDPSRGDVNAPITIVEFTDFQCPSCAAMHPILEEVLKPYGNKVRLVVRDFPLNQHENAQKAAEAANAANAQGKFFEYIALLYQRQKALDLPSLKKYATELGLNRTRFDAELDRGIYATEVQHDIEDGEIYGVGSTPTLFINGVMLKTLNAEALREAIDKAAAARQPGAARQ